MEKCGICTYVTHEFAVFPKAKPREKTSKRVGYQGTYSTLSTSREAIALT